jgi:alcohol dehydrogenase class IV
MTELRANWSFPTTIWFGAGRIAELPAACRQLAIARPLLVTDAGLADHAMVHAAQRCCQAEGYETGLFADVRGNPVEANVNEGVTAFRRGHHDGVIGLGGGSALDAAKAVALMVGQSRPVWDFEDREDWWTRADAEAIVPVIAIPTTAGTGSEVGRAAVITDHRDDTKKIIFHPRLMPGVVIADPELTLGLPAKITAATGMDALSHNLEAYCSPPFHPMAAGIALEGTRLIKEWLPIAVKDGGNLEARSHMLAAASMGATAFQRGLGAMHSLSHPCGALLDTHHGLTNAVVMPYVLAYNRPAIESRLAALARYLGLPSPSGAAVIRWVLELRAELHIPHTLAELGVGEALVPKMAAMALRDPSSGGNPLPLSEEILATLYRDAIAGRLPPIQ